MFDLHRPIHFDNIMSKAVRVWQTGDVVAYVKKCEDAGRKRKRGGRSRGNVPKKLKSAGRGDSSSAEETSSDDDADAESDREAEDLEMFDRRYYRGNWYASRCPQHPRRGLPNARCAGASHHAGAARA